MSVPSLARFKCCTKCDCTKPATTEFFKKRVNGLLGLEAHCKRCRAIYVRLLRNKNRSEYNEYMRQYRIDNDADLKAKRRDYYHENREHLLEYQRQWNDAHRERVNARQRERRSNPLTKDAEYETVRRYQKRNPDRKVLWERRRRARKAQAVGSHSLEEVKQMRRDQSHLCAYCECSIAEYFEVDHMIPLSRNGSDDWSNLALVCKRCNTRKGTMTTEEFWGRHFAIYN